MSKIMGTPGNDNLPGTPQNDTLIGLAGNDTLLGLGGNDLLIDTVGNDILDGGQGNDSLSAGSGLDNLKGGTGNDILWGGAGGDRLSGDTGDDTLVGGIGNDTLDGGKGNDLLIGGGDMTLFGLTDNNMLVAFDSDRPNRAQTIGVTGIDGTLIGIDFRPQDGKLYGITDTNNIYTINTTTGAAMLVSSVNPIGFNGGNMSGVDFNPTPDRLRLVGSNDENFRVNVDNGTVVDGDTVTGGIQPDTNVAYAMGDVNFGADPNITAAGYTNSLSPSPDPTRRTTLYEIDSNLDVLVRQGGLNFLAADPNSGPSPNTGQLFTVGSLGVDFGPTAGFDVFSPANGVNVAYAATGSTLYTIDLATGAATSLGTIGNGSFNFVGLAATAAPEPGENRNDLLTGGRGNDTLMGGMGRDTLTGGLGMDSFSFGSANENADVITDFSVASDTILVSASGFGGAPVGLVAGAAIAANQFVLGSSAQDAADRFIYSQNTGRLFFDADGTGAIAQVQIAQLSTGLSLTNNDIFVLV
jgi:hypothetical protein